MKNLKYKLKLLKTFAAVTLLIFNYTITKAQNLVPNPSFELYSTCPNNGGQISFANYWYSPTQGTTDYFNQCGTMGYSVPSNLFGYRSARTGVAFAGIVTYEKLHGYAPQDNNREYIEVLLNDSLEAGKKYCVIFYVSLADSSEYSANDIGAFFSSTPDTNYNSHSGMYVLSSMPQVFNTNSNPLTNDTGWTEISGSFIANGGEKYMTIGNFKDSSHTTANYKGGASDVPGAYYYIDDVSVTLCDSLLDGIPETGFAPKVNIYPTISNGLYHVEVNNITAYALYVHNILGYTVYHNASTSYNKLQIDLSKEPSGIYFITVESNHFFFTQKVIKIN